MSADFNNRPLPNPRALRWSTYTSQRRMGKTWFALLLIQLVAFCATATLVRVTHETGRKPATLARTNAKKSVGERARGGVEVCVSARVAAGCPAEWVC